MKNKIIYSIIVCFWALVTSLSAQSIGLRFPDTTMVQGDTIVLPLYVDSTLTGEEVYSFNLDVRYSTSYFQYVGVSLGSLTSDFGDLITNSNTLGSVLISGASGTALAGTGTLFYVHLKAINYYSWGSEVSLYSTSILNEGLPLIVPDAGRVGIQQAPRITISPNDGELLVGESLAFRVYGDTVSPFRFSVVDASVGSINDDGLFTAIASGHTQVEVSDSNNTVDETNNEIKVFDFSLNSPNDLTEWQGAHIDVPVIIHNTGGQDFISGSFKCSYDDRVLTFDTLIAEGILLESAFVEQVQVSDDEVMVNFASDQVLGDDSVLVYLRFDISRTQTGSSYFDFTDIVFNENVIGLNRRGYFKTINYQTVSFYSSKYTLIAGDVWPMSVSGGLLPYTFSSNNETAATISDDAYVTALRGGKVNFTATDSVGSEKVSNEFTIYDTYVEIADTTGPLLSDYLLPVFIGDFPSGTSVSAFQMELSFNQSELEFLSVVSANSLSDGWSLAHSLTTNKLMVSGAGTNEVTEKGILFYVKFRFTENFVLNERVSVSIDKVMLNEGSPTALERDGSIQCVKREDLMVSELLSPLSDCELSSEENVTIEIRNNGFLDYYKGDTLMVSYTFQWATEVVDTIILSQTFPMKSVMQYTFGSILDMSQNSRYYLEVKTKLSAELDGNVSNDKIVQYITNYTEPILDLGQDISTCSPEPIVITAPEGFFSYEWSSGDVDTNAVTIDTSSTVWLKVINSYGCEVIDTIEVELFAIPAQPYVMYESTQACKGDSIRLEAPAGYAQYRWTTGQTDSVIYVFVSGEYGVVVYNQGMCESDTSALVSVTFMTPPVANFSYTNDGLRVVFTNLSSSATDYKWHFGDGSTSEEMNPVHTYEWRDNNDFNLKSAIVGPELFSYHVRLVSSNGNCNDYWVDTIPSSAFLANAVSKTIGLGESYEFGGEILTEAGIYYHNFQLPTGKDSIVQLDLKVITNPDDTLNLHPIDAKGAVIVYPNPAQDVIMFSSPYDMLRISFYNGFGVEVYSQEVSGQKAELNLSGICKRGIYFSKVMTHNRGSFYVKILIE